MAKKVTTYSELFSHPFLLPCNIFAQNPPNPGFAVWFGFLLTVVGTVSRTAPRSFVADHVPDVDPARPDALGESGEPEEVLVPVDVDEHGHPAEVGLEGVPVDEERPQPVREPQHVRLPVDVHPLRLGVQVQADLLVQVAVDDELDVAGAEVGPGVGVGNRIRVIGAS